MVRVTSHRSVMPRIYTSIWPAAFSGFEAHWFGERTREVFPVCPDIRDGAPWANDRPRWGTEIDEAMAVDHPFPDDPLNGGWPELRLADGTIARL